jgi:hypothetical protein
VYDSGEDEGTPFLVMELLSGRTLADELADDLLTEDRAREVGGQVLAALAASHRTGVLHRDVKPANVLIAADGSARLADFGIAKAADAVDATQVGMVVGTTAYLAPERLAGEPATVRSDLYAVGVLLYEALTGHKPFDVDNPVALVAAIDRGPAPPLAEARPDIDPDLAAAVERALAKGPADRFASAEEMLAAVDAQHRRLSTGPAAPAWASVDADRALAAIDASHAGPTPVTPPGTAVLARPATGPERHGGAPGLAGPLAERMARRMAGRLGGRMAGRMARRFGGRMVEGRHGPAGLRRPLLAVTVAAVLGLGTVAALAWGRSGPSEGPDRPAGAVEPGPGASLPPALDDALIRLDRTVRP